MCIVNKEGVQNDESYLAKGPCSMFGDLTSLHLTLFSCFKTSQKSSSHSCHIFGSSDFTHINLGAWIVVFYLMVFKQMRCKSNSCVLCCHSIQGCKLSMVWKWGLGTSTQFGEPSYLAVVVMANSRTLLFRLNCPGLELTRFGSWNSRCSGNYSARLNFLFSFVLLKYFHSSFGLFHPVCRGYNFYE